MKLVALLRLAVSRQVPKTLVHMAVLTLIHMEINGVAMHCVGGGW